MSDQSQPGVEIRPGRGARFSDNQLQEIILPELRRLQAANPNNLLTKRAVLDAARDPISPLHQFFEWDDRKAADKYRLSQAASMIRSIEIRVIEADPSKTQKVRAFHSVSVVSQPAQGSGRRRTTGYTDLSTISKSPTMRRAVIASARSAMLAAQEKVQGMLRVLSPEEAPVIEELSTLLTEATTKLGDLMESARTVSQGT